MKINEIFKQTSCKDLIDLNQQVAVFAKEYAPNITEKEVLDDIQFRNKSGESLMSSEVLAVHVQDKKVVKDTVIYLTLTKPFNYFSDYFKEKFVISKVVVIIVNPGHKLNCLTKLTNFISDEKK